MQVPSGHSAVSSPRRPFAGETGGAAGAFVGMFHPGNAVTPEAIDASGPVLATVRHFSIDHTTACGRTGARLSGCYGRFSDEVDFIYFYSKHASRYAPVTEIPISFYNVQGTMQDKHT